MLKFDNQAQIFSSLRKCERPFIFQKSVLSLIEEILDPLFKKVTELVCKYQRQHYRVLVDPFPILLVVPHFL